jgi:stearoyl-CoA desaturase (delta-9 desaturase)
MLASAEHRAADLLTGLNPPAIPSREDIRQRAAALFVKTPSLDEIVERAHRMVIEKLCVRLAAVA